MHAHEVKYQLVGPAEDGCNPVVLVEHIASGICATSNATHLIMRNRQIAIDEIEKLLKAKK